MGTLGFFSDSGGNMEKNRTNNLSVEVNFTMTATINRGANLDENVAKICSKITVRSILLIM